MSPIAEQRPAPTLGCRSAVELRVKRVRARDDGRRHASPSLRERPDQAHTRHGVGHQAGTMIVASLSAQLQARTRREWPQAASDIRQRTRVPLATSNMTARPSTTDGLTHCL